MYSAAHYLLPAWMTILLYGFGAAHAESKGPSWLQVQTILARSDVRTYEDLCLQLSRLPLDENSQKSFADLSKRIQEFTPLNKYIEDTYQQEAQYEVAKTTKQDMSVAAIRKRLSDEIAWKSATPELALVTRHYRLYTTAASDSGKLRAYNPIWYGIYTDEKGRILGWDHTKVPGAFTIVIVNGTQRTVDTGSVGKALIEMMAYPDAIGKQPPVLFAVRYKDGPQQNKVGTMSYDHDVIVSNGMVFEVASIDGKLSSRQDDLKSEVDH